MVETSRAVFASIMTARLFPNNFKRGFIPRAFATAAAGGVLALLVTPPAFSFNRSVMEGIHATNNAVFVDTQNARVGVGTGGVEFSDGSIQLTAGIDSATLNSSAVLLNPDSQQASNVNVSSGTIGILSVPSLPVNQCVQVGPGGQLETTGDACGFGSAGVSSGAIIPAAQNSVAFYSNSGTTNTISGAGLFTYNGTSVTASGMTLQTETINSAIYNTGFTYYGNPASPGGFVAAGPFGEGLYMQSAGTIIMTPLAGIINIYSAQSTPGTDAQINLFAHNIAGISGNYIGIKSPAALSATTVFTLPASDGSSGQALTTDGDGNWSFTTISGSSGSFTGNSIYPATGTPTFPLGYNFSQSFSTTSVGGQVFMNFNDPFMSSNTDYLFAMKQAGFAQGYLGFTNTSTPGGALATVFYDGNKNQIARFDDNDNVQIGGQGGSSRLNVKGNVTIGSTYADTTGGGVNPGFAAPTSGLTVQGNVLIASTFTNSGAALAVAGAISGTSVQTQGTTAGQWTAQEGPFSGVSGIASGADVLYADSSSHTWTICSNMARPCGSVIESTGAVTAGHLAKFSTMGAIVDGGPGTGAAAPLVMEGSAHQETALTVQSANSAPLAPLTQMIYSAEVSTEPVLALTNNLSGNLLYVHPQISANAVQVLGQDGAVVINNSGSKSYALDVFSSTGISGNAPLVYVQASSPTFTNPMVVFESSGTGGNLLQLISPNPALDFHESDLANGVGRFKFQMVANALNLYGRTTSGSADLLDYYFSQASAGPYFMIRSTGAVRLMDLANDHYTGLKSSTVLAGNFDYVLPSSTGTLGAALVTVGVGVSSTDINLGWGTVGGITSGSTLTWTAPQNFSENVIVSSGFSTTGTGPFFFSDNGSDVSSSTGTLDVYRSNSYSGANLFSVGSSNQGAQFVIQDLSPVNMTRYGANLGSLQVGIAANTNQILSNQSSQSYLNLWNSGEVDLQSATSGNGGKDIVLKPATAEGFRVSNTTGTVITSVSGNVIWISTNGHVNSTGTAPGVSSCGTGTPTVTGNDHRGFISVGGGSVTSCTLTFAVSYGAGCSVSCLESDTSTTPTADITSVNATTVVFGFSASIGGGTIFYDCEGVGSLCK